MTVQPQYAAWNAALWSVNASCCSSVTTVSPSGISDSEMSRSNIDSCPSWSSIATIAWSISVKSASKSSTIATGLA